MSNGKTIFHQIMVELCPNYGVVALLIQPRPIVHNDAVRQPIFLKKYSFYKQALIAKSSYFTCPSDPTVKSPSNRSCILAGSSVMETATAATIALEGMSNGGHLQRELFILLIFGEMKDESFFYRISKHETPSVRQVMSSSFSPSSSRPAPMRVTSSKIWNYFFM